MKGAFLFVFETDILKCIMLCVAKTYLVNKCLQLMFIHARPMGNPDTMACVDLIRPIVFSARLGHQEKLGRMKKPQEFALLTLFVNGCGIVGWHGYVGTAFL